MSGPALTLKINNRLVEARPGMTVLECASSHGIFIPSLCDLEGLPAFAGCRLCLVEISGRPHRSPACQTRVEEGMEVITTSPELEDLRRSTLELILSEHPYFCLLCQERTNCDELKKTMVKTLEPGGCVFCPKDRSCELQRVVEYLKVKQVAYEYQDRGLSLWQDDPFIAYNPNMCLLCGRCVRVCSEVRGERVLSFIGRGKQTAIGTFFQRSLKEADCSFCGACLEVCPTAAFEERGITGIRGRLIYEQPFICPLCSSACELKGEFLEVSQLRKIKPSSAEGPAFRSGCARGRFGLREALEAARPEALPLIKRNGRQQPASLEEALDQAASAIRNFKPQEIALVATDQVSAEGLLALVSLARALKIDNVYSFYPEAFLDRLVAFENQHGIRFERSLPLQQISQFKTFFLVDTDLKAEALACWLEVWPQISGGAGYLVLDPGLNRSARLARHHLKCRPGEEDKALIGLLKRITQQLPELSFYHGYHELLENLKSQLDEELQEGSGLKGAELDEAAAVLISGRPVLILFGQRLLRQPGWRENLAALWNLSLRLDARLLPVISRGQERLLEILKSRSGIRTISDCQQLEQDIRSGNIRALYVLGDLPLAEKPEWLLVQNPFRTTLAEGADVFLPSATCLETVSPVVDLFGLVKTVSQTSIYPGGKERLSEAVLINRLAGLLGIDLELPSAEALQAMIRPPEKIISDQSLTYLSFFPADSRAEPEVSSSIERRAGELVVMVGQNQDYYAGISMAEVSSGFRWINNPDWLWLNPEEAAVLGLQAGQRVVLETPDGVLSLEVSLDRHIRAGSAVVNPILDNPLKIRLYGRGLFKGRVRVTS
ncbi:MAG: 2Fe-2S iron-sulfur cluster-binding protein [Candidatus Saccharicenans sp.]|uniref:2Fe-2S iron-sulfur cluster-binding protein n=1 Tax=Candidatus Saccharicenans sp. TaxID=2819258 RepID=UPI00404B2058